MLKMTLQVHEITIEKVLTVDRYISNVKSRYSESINIPQTDNVVVDFTPLFKPRDFGITGV